MLLAHGVPRNSASSGSSARIFSARERRLLTVPGGHPEHGRHLLLAQVGGERGEQHGVHVGIKVVGALHLRPAHQTAHQRGLHHVLRLGG